MPEIFTHKKFQAGSVMSIVIFLGQFFTGLAQTGNVINALAMVDWLVVATPMLTAIGAQGLADFGKEKTKVEVNNGQ